MSIPDFLTWESFPGCWTLDSEVEGLFLAKLAQLCSWKKNMWSLKSPDENWMATTRALHGKYA